MNKDYYDKVYRYFNSIKSVSHKEVSPIWVITKECENEYTESPFKIYEHFR